MAIQPRKRSLTLVQILEQMGFEFHLDWDDSLLVEAPEAVDAAELARRILADPDDAVAALMGRRLLSLRRCIGGPLDGQPHAWHFRYMTIYADREEGCPKCGGKWSHKPPCRVYAPSYEAVHLRRGKWAVYEVMQDRRAYFRGYAASKRKARRGQFSKVSDQ